MAKKDWTQTQRDSMGTWYLKRVGDKECEIIAYNSWERGYCQLNFYQYSREYPSGNRVTIDGEDFYESGQDALEFVSCTQAEKVALAWLNK